MITLNGSSRVLTIPQEDRLLGVAGDSYVNFITVQVPYDCSNITLGPDGQDIFLIFKQEGSRTKPTTIGAYDTFYKDDSVEVTFMVEPKLIKRAGRYVISLCIKTYDEFDKYAQTFHSLNAYLYVQDTTQHAEIGDCSCGCSTSSSSSSPVIFLTDEEYAVISEEVFGDLGGE